MLHFDYCGILAVPFRCYPESSCIWSHHHISYCTISSIAAAAATAAVFLDTESVVHWLYSLVFTKLGFRVSIIPRIPQNSANCT